VKISRVLLPALLLPLASLLAADFTIEGRKFTVPDGFTVTRVTDTNLIQRPVSAGFDDQGRLYVTDSDGSSAAPSEQLKHPASRILRLEDTDGDGRFDRSVVFADKVMFPSGCLWHDGWVYVAEPPSIWRYRDTDGDGRADQRQEWFKGGTLTGCANDIHGPYLGPDGFLYWTKGAFAEQTHTLGNGRVLKDKAAHIYRMKPDGTDLDVIMSGGMDNPVEIAFTPEGEAIFTSTFIDFSQPGFRDGIGHAVYGGVFGKVNDVLDDGRVKRTSPDLFHPFYQAGNAAECGLTRYESDVFGAEYRDNFFATTFNLHKVTRHILRPSGATYASTDSDFLVCDDVDFHPTDVLPDADGSLLVVDTGGWYRLCCPSSQLAKPDVLGAIYRVRKTGIPKLAGAEKAVAYGKLAKLSVDQGKMAVALKRSARLRDPAAAALMLELLDEHGAATATSVTSAQITHVAAEGLGRLMDKRGVLPLLRCSGLTTDSFLQHSLTFALIEIAAPAATRAGLTDPNAKVKRAALIALDQMDGSDLKPGEVTPLLSAADEPLRAAANWIIGRHPEWGGELAGWFREQLGTPASDPARLASLHAQFRILTHADAGQQLLADAVTKPAFRSATRVAALDAMAEAGLKEPPVSWRNAVLTALSPPSKEVAAAIRAARSLNASPEVAAALLALGRDAIQSTELRLDALAALPAGAALAAAELDFLRDRLAPANPPVTRATAAGVLARAKLDAAQLATVTDTLKSAGPLELTKLLATFDGGGDDGLGEKLVAALRDSKSAKALPPAQLRPHFAKFSAVTQKSAEEFFATLDADVAKQAAHLDALQAELKTLSGDLRRGQATFNGPKAACATCHRIGYVGGNVGPELTKIGEVPTTVVLKDGEQQNGIVKRETADELVLVNGPGPELHLRRSDIAEQRPGTMSVMPGGLDTQLTRQELADLLFFVRTVRWR
jgi:putative membrane-bound dehydrogenase-like protein